MKKTIQKFVFSFTGTRLPVKENTTRNRQPVTVIDNLLRNLVVLRRRLPLRQLKPSDSVLRVPPKFGPPPPKQAGINLLTDMFN